MYTSPSNVPSGWGSAKARTSVSPRRPVARRFSRRIAAPSSRVTSTRAPAARSQTSTRRATRARRAWGGAGESGLAGRRLPGRRDAPTGLRVVDAVVVHPGDDAHKLLLHLLELLQGKSTRLNSSHLGISYAVFCLKKKISSTKLIRTNHCIP